MTSGGTEVRDYNLERLIFLSDGVFAIAITLLAIELHPPEGWDGTIAGLLNGTYRQFIAFGISFLFIAIYWASHRRTYQRFRRADGVLTALNFVVLALITLTPFFTSLIAERGPYGEPLLIYMSLVVAVGVASALQWGYAAFFGRGILAAPMGFPLKLLIFLILLIVPAAMALMGLVASRPEYVWLYAVMLVLVGAVMWLRRIVGRRHEG
jgi:uncharacterized membrane protein